jgi:hypothetical protein
LRKKFASKRQTANTNNQCTTDDGNQYSNKISWLNVSTDDLEEKANNGKKRKQT